MRKEPMREVAQAARRAQSQLEPWVEPLARFGLAAKGVVYVLVGGIAAKAAFGSGDVEGSQGAIASLADEPFGQLLLWLITLGLFGYVVWRGVSAIRNPEGEGGAKRVFYGVSAVVYAGLAIQAFRLATGDGGGGDSGWTATLMEQPFGRWLVGAAGVAIAGYGLHQIWRGWTIDLDDALDLTRLSPTARTWVIRFGRFGLVSRGIVFGILGFMFVRAALEADPSRADGVEGVLASMQGTAWLLAPVGLGLIAYGLFNLVRARYRRIHAA